MDPLSITLACVTLGQSVAALSSTLSQFVREVRSARSDLDAVSRELGSLRTILETLQDDFAGQTAATFPDTLQKQVNDIIENCHDVLKEIDAVLVNQRASRIGEAASWTLRGKEDVKKLRASLEAHRSALEIALSFVDLHISREIKTDTTIIRMETQAIKTDTEQILAEIERLREQLPNNTADKYILEKYLDNMTNYAGSVVGDETTYQADIEYPYASTGFPIKNRLVESVHEIKIPDDRRSGGSDTPATESVQSSRTPTLVDVEKRQSITSIQIDGPLVLDNTRLETDYQSKRRSEASSTKAEESLRNPRAMPPNPSTRSVPLDIYKPNVYNTPLNGKRLNTVYGNTNGIGQEHGVVRFTPIRETLAIALKEGFKFEQQLMHQQTRILFAPKRISSCLDGFSIQLNKFEYHLDKMIKRQLVDDAKECILFIHLTPDLSRLLRHLWEERTKAEKGIPKASFLCEFTSRIPLAPLKTTNLLIRYIVYWQADAPKTKSFRQQIEEAVAKALGATISVNLENLGTEFGDLCVPTSSDTIMSLPLPPRKKKKGFLGLF